MARASHKKFGAGQQDRGKGDGSGGMAPAEIEPPLPREALSNRDAARHSGQRGLDSRHVQAERQGGTAPAPGARPRQDRPVPDDQGPGRVEDEP